MIGRAIVALPTFYVSRNTVNLSSKITVITLFGLRLPNIAFMTIAATSYRSIEQTATGHTDSVTTAAIWSQVLLGYSLSSASFPCIRSFLTAFLADSKYRIHGTSTGGSYNHGSHSQSARQTNTQRSAKVTSVIGAGPNAQHLPDETGSVASDASQRMMIERSVEIQVAVESANASDIARQEGRAAFPYQGGQQGDVSRREPRVASRYQSGQ
ncbi:hypothetical protein B0A55_08728 [Friedmanniomyces simplex]|uniref:Uncharacterized protein n=1 Tax=Friedmanniomyces simplex TaxID=329884 RepID=A0A4U0WZU6_9PEZI|nr:hypothetical protein B0A55_08728 [Friedmanniomyces simplex]